MLPQGIFGISPFALVFPLTIAVGLLGFFLAAERSGIPWTRTLRLHLSLTVVGLLGARGFSFVFDTLWNPLDPGRAPIVGGWRASGGLFALAIALPLLRRRLLPEVSLARYADLIAPAAAFALGVYRLHCLLAGCCGGPVCNGFYCIAYAPFTEIWQAQVAVGHIHGPVWTAPTFPLHLAFMVASFGVGIFLWRRDPQRRFDGETFLLFLALHEGTKFALEFLREPPLLLLQLSSLVPALLGLVAWITITSRLRPRAQPS